MSFHINSDKEKIRGVNSKFIGDNEATIRIGTGADEKEVLRAELDSATQLPRIGINRTGNRVNNIVLETAGTGYTVNPNVTIGPPNVEGGIQALASAFIFNGKVTTIAVNNPGSGYTIAPLVTIEGGGGSGATATAELDTVDYELDINGAIRTSTSIISDTARILNLDIDNFVTPDPNFRGPNLKTYMNNTGTLWAANVIIQKDQYRYFGANVYQSLNTGQTGSEAPEHVDGIVKNGAVDFKHIGFRVNDPTEFGYNTTGEAGIYPRSITPLLGDRSDKVATTEYVLNLATNDVGGRIYVSAQIGSDLNDGRSAVNPVRTIKKAAQEAWKTPGVKETIIVSGGDYVEDNPISLPPDASIVGDNLRLVIIRPANPGKHMVKFGDKNYVIGVTYRDQIDSNGDSVATWDYAMVFDDKQRIMVDKDANGDIGTSFPVGHQIFGPQQFRVTFQNNTGLATLVSGLIVKGVNTGSRAKIFDVTFATTVGASAYVNGTVDVQLQSGSFVEGEQFSYITSAGAGSAINLAITGQQGPNTLRFSQDPTGTIPGGTIVQLVGTPSTGAAFTGYYEVAEIDTTQSASNIWDVTFFPILAAPTWDATGVGGTYVINQATAQTETIDTTAIKSIRAEGEVVSVDDDYTTTLPISRIDFSLQGDASITQDGFQNSQFGNAEDSGGIVFYTNQLVGRTNTHDFKEGQEILIENLPTSSPDLSELNGKQRIYKVLEDADGRCRRFVIPKKIPAITDANFDPGQFATVKSFSKIVTLSLLNSPNSFPLSSPISRRFQDACILLRNNREFIADEVLGRINAEFANAYYQVYDITGGGTTFKVVLGQTPIDHTYVSGGTVKFENTTVNITNFVYDNAVTGSATITVDAALTTLVEDDTVKLADILLSCAAGQKTYPSYSARPSSNDSTNSDGDEQCKQDVVHFVNALVRDLEFGTNHNTIEGASKVIVGGDIAYIKNEIVQNFRAIEYARELCIYAMRNWKTGNGTTTEPTYTPKYSSITRYFDSTIINTTAGNPVCADVKSAIDTLTYLWVDIITKNQSATYLDAAYLIERNKYLIADQALRDTLGQFPLFALNNTDERKCKRDLRITLSNLAKDLVLGGNENIVIAAEEYFTQTALTGIPEAQKAETIYAYQRAKTYAIAAMRNWTDGTYVDLTPTNATYNPSTGALEVLFPDPTIAPSVGDRIAFKEDALNWECTYNSVTGQHPGPSRTDPTYGKSFEITAVSSSGGTTTVSTNVGDAGVASGSAHTFISAVTDGTIIVYNPTVLTSPYPKFEDWNILPDSNAGSPIAQYTPSAVSYNPVNGDLTMTVTGHSVTTSNSVKVAPESMVFTCGMDGNATEHKYPQVGQPAYGTNKAVTSTTASSFTINVGATGADQQWTPSDATYDPATGALVLTIGSGHGLSVGEGVVLDDDSLSFTCTMDGNSSTKTYPRAGHDPFSGRSIPIDSVSDTTVTLNVGVSPANKNFTPTNATYNATTGDMVLALGQHGLAVDKGIVIADGALSFTCDKDNNSTLHSYPRSTDPASGESLSITNVASTQHTATNAVYTPTTGSLVITSAGHNFANGDYVKIADDSLTFNCVLDGGATNKTYPRANFDNLSGRWVAISNVTTDTFEINTGPSSYTGGHTFVSASSNGIERQTGNVTVNVGTSPQVNHQVTGATYDPTNGDLLLTIGAHTLSVGEGVRIATDSLTFTCSKDGGATTHTYPRNIIDNYTATDADYDPTTGILGLQIPAHGIKVGDWIKLDDNSLTFTCQADGGGTQHTYPRATDPISGKFVQVQAVPTTDSITIQVLAIVPSTNVTQHQFISATANGVKAKRDRAFEQSVPITAVGTGTITLNVGPSPTVNHTVTDATYNTTSGDMELTIGNHALQVGESIKLSPNSLTFECPAAVGTHTFVSGTTGGITPNAGSAVTAATGTTYNPTTGDMVLEIGSHSLTTSNTVQIANGAVTFTCDADNNGSNHAYPRATDPVSGQDIAITAVGATTITVNVGIASSNSQSSYPRASGAATGSGADYAYDAALPITARTATTITVNVNGGQGAISVNSAHTFVSATTNGLQSGGGYSHTWTAAAANAIVSGGGYTHTFVSAVTDGVQFIPQSAHTFVSATTNALKHLPRSAHTFIRSATNSVLVYSTIGTLSQCANVEASIDTSMSLFEDILDGTIAAGATARTSNALYDTAQIITYPENYISDANNQRVAIRGDFDEYPIIEASPYTQNSSVISFLGGSGALVDGAKVKQPNCPFPGLELDGSASFPNQGKSMVASAFTIVSFGGTGYKIINDGYVQLVSVFVIFCADGVYCESGGYASITNSATNFGTFALRARGFSATPYVFDVATVSNVSSTPTGRTILTVSGLGREPLEHYVVKIDGYTNTNTEIEYFIDVVAGVTVGPPFSAQLTIDDGTGGAMDLTDVATGQAVSTSVLSGKTINLHRPSICNSSSHTWEFAGSGTNYLALPENGGTKIEAYEQVSENYGRVYVSGTDELGDFKVGTFARIENRTGNITFTGTVTISEVEFLKLKGGDVVVTGFDASNTLGGANSSDSKLPTQKAVRDYITNNLGPFINKPYSTNAVPRALVELTDSGKISVDQIPALRPFSVYTVADQAERTSLEGALAGDIAIQQDTATSFILNNDTDSLFLGFNPDAAYAFTIGDIFTGSLTTGRIQSTEYRKGVVYQINVSNGGSGYTVAPTVSFAGGNPEAGAVAASATCTIANGQVVTVTIETFNGFKGGKGYTTAPNITFAAPAGAGTQAQGTTLIESRLYGDIVNNIKIEDTDTFDDSTTPSANTININRVVNTSSFDANNWVSLSSNQVAASDITSGVIETDRLALGGAANSFTFLRGDSNFALAMQSIKGAESRYFARLASQCTTGSSQMIFTTNSDVLIGHEVKNTVNGIQANTNITGVVTAAGLTTISLNNPVNQTIPLGTIIEFERGASPLTFESTFTQGNFVDDVIITNGGTGYTNGQYYDVSLTGGTGTGLKVNIVVANNVVTEITVTDGGTGYSGDFTVTTAPGAIGGGSSLVLEAKVSTVNRQYANVAIDVQRVTDLTISADLYGTIGVSRYKKSQFNIGTAGNGSVELKTGADSGLDADLLDGVQGSFYLNSSNQSAGTLSSDRLSGTYNIAISGTAGNTIRVLTGTNNPSSSPAPNNFSSGIVSNTIFNSANGLSDGGTRNMTVTFRAGGTGFDAGFGGVRQLAFTDNDNMWLRGSGTGVGSFGTWAKVWTELNDGLDSGLDADKLDNKQGTWYQNALNINSGTLSDNRLPRFVSATNFRDNVTVKGFLGDPKFRIYFSGVILDTSASGVFAPGNPINLYNANAQAVGSFIIDSVTTNDDTADNFNDYTILIGRLTSGNFVGALTAGSASNRQPFDDFTLEDGNTVDVGKIQNNAGSGELKLGRVDGQSSTPAILFRSSQLVSNGDDHYTAKLEAAGGNASAGSGTLALTVLNADAFTVNGQKVWNEGNIEFSSANIANNAVQRDSSGNFSATTITANLTGASSLNVLKTGDTMTGALVLTGAGSNLTVSGTATVNNTTTINADLNVDSNTLFVDSSDNKVGIGETVFTTRAGQSYVKLRMRTSNFDTYEDDHRMDFGQFNGNWVDGSGGVDSQFGMSFTWQSQVRGGLLYDHRSSERMALWSSYGRLAFMVDPGTSGDEVPITVGTEAMTIVPSGTVGINTTGPSTSYKLDVNGATRLRNFVTLDQANDNSGAGILFLGSSSERNFRIGNQWGHSNAFEITPSTSNGGNAWDGTPAIYVRGDHRVGIYTSSISGTDPTNNVVRSYRLNVNGDMNIDGQFFQNNQEFVTSRWTEASNGNDIFRLSKVGINKQDPTYFLHINGSTNIEGQSFSNGVNESVLYANGEKQWLDSYGIFKTNAQTVGENITVPNGVNCGSFGPITINNNIIITVADGGSWNIV